jgi:hypothetical protein
MLNHAVDRLILQDMYQYETLTTGVDTTTAIVSAAGSTGVTASCQQSR